MSDQINIRFFSELNDFLPPDKRNTNFNVEVKKTRSVKDLVESIGVPHPEIDLIIVNDESVDFNQLIQGGEQIDVYPKPNTVNITPLTRNSHRVLQISHCRLDLARDYLIERNNISYFRDQKISCGITDQARSVTNCGKCGLIHNQPQPSPEQGFVLDVHLGKLAAYLRMLGFDTLYRNDYDDPTLADISANENRILLSCDRKLLMRKQVRYGYIIRSDNPRQQIVEVLTRFELFDFQAEFARCMECNGIIHAIDKQQIESQLLPLTREHYDKFYRCDSCKKIYWEGSHFSKMQAVISNPNPSLENTKM